MLFFKKAKFSLIIAIVTGLLAGYGSYNYLKLISQNKGSLKDSQGRPDCY